MNLIAVSGTTLVSAFLSEMVDPLGASGSNIGLIISAMTMPGIILSPLIGILTDRIGRKRVLIPSLLLFGTAGTLCSTATTLEMMLLFRVLQGIGWAALIPILAVLVGDIYDEERRAQGIGAGHSALSLGAMIFPTVGGILAIISWRIPFLLYLIAIPIALVSAILMKEAPITHKVVTQDQSLKENNGYWQIVRQPKLIIAMSGGFLSFVLLYGVVFAYYGFLMEEKFSATSDIRGLFLSLLMLMNMLSSLQAGRIAERAPKQWLILLGFCLQGLSLILLPLQLTLVMLIPFTILFGISRGITAPMLATFILDSSSEDTRGRIYFTYEIPTKFGQTLGPVIAGLIYGIAGTDNIFWWIGGATVVISATLMVITAVQKKIPSS
jgi:MFS family permease